MSPGILLIIITIASLIGSLQLGPTNGLVMRTSLHDYNKAILITIGGTLPEAVYAAIAMASLSMFSISSHHTQLLHMSGAGLLILFGVYFILDSLEHPKLRIPKIPHKNAPITTGFLSGITNVQLLFFWITTIGYLTLYIPLANYTIWHVLAVLGGSIVGAFITDYAFAALVHRHKERIIRLMSPAHMSRIIGIIVMLVGVIQLIRSVSL